MKFIIKGYFFPLVILLVVLPVILLRDFTPANELRYLSIANEALHNGHFFAFTNHGLLYADKPPLYFWIIMFGKWLLGNHYMWFLSLSSVIPALVIVQIMDKWTMREIGGSGRFIAKLMLMSSGLFLGLSVTLRMDMIMCMFIVLSLYTFYKIFKRINNKWDPFLFPFYIFMAVFSKGPVGLLIPLFATIVFLFFKKRTGTIGLYWGWKTWIILLTACLIWFVGVYLEGGRAYLSNLLFHQTIDRSINSFHHKEPFYYYFISFWYSLAPWSLLVVGVIFTAVKSHNIKTDLERFFLAIIVVTFIALSCISSKLAVYLIPIFPFFIYLTVLILQRLKWNRWLALTIGLPASILAFSFFIVLYLILFAHLDFLNHTFILVAVGLLSSFAAGALYPLYKIKNMEQSIILLAVGIFVAVFVAAWALPSINSQFGYADLCAVAKKTGTEKHISTYSAFALKYPENMDVFLGREVKVVTRDNLLHNKYSNMILLLKNSVIESQKNDTLLRAFLVGKERYVVGRYSVIVLTKDKLPE